MKLFISWLNLGGGNPLNFSKPSQERSCGSSEVQHKNLLQSGQGTHELAEVYQILETWAKKQIYLYPDKNRISSNRLIRS